MPAQHHAGAEGNATGTLTREDAILVLTREVTEKIYIDGPCEITVLTATRGRTRLGFEAPEGTKILRTELLENRPVGASVVGDDQPPAG